VEEYVVANKADLVVMGSMALGGPSNQVSESEIECESGSMREWVSD
jgi:hypothetical protein